MSRHPKKDKNCDRNDFKDEYSIKQKVKSQCVKSQHVVESKIRQLEVDELIVKHQSGAPFEINESVTIVGKNIPLQPSCEGGFCDSNPPTPTPASIIRDIKSLEFVLFFFFAMNNKRNRII